MFRAIILGAPASGKGTISSRIVKHFGITHISSGDLLRKHIQYGSVLGVAAGKFINKGELVPDDLMMQLVLSELSHLSSRHWLLDGFPRTLVQGRALLDQYSLNMAIALEVPVEEIVDRVKGRWVHIPSGRVYNETYNQPKLAETDDVTGEKLSQRPDDAPEAVRQRLKIYDKTIEPLLKLYEEKGILFRFAGRTSDEIWPKVKNAIEKFPAFRQKVDAG